jgi:hypothetical protein
MTSILSSRRFNTWFPWAAGLILVAGIVAVLVVYVGNTGQSVDSKVTDRESGPAVVATAGKNVPLDPKARQVAGEFILTAVTRKNLAKSWPLTHPDLRQGMTEKQWETGNIPVQYYPASAIDQASFKIDESHANEATLEVALLPKKGANVRPQIFFITLKKHDGQWQVSYWAPRGSPAIPQASG